MTDDILTDLLAERVMEWRAVPDRYIKSGRSWLPRWRFSPLSRLEHAFQLLDRLTTKYRVERTGERSFTVYIWFQDRFWQASGTCKPRVITMAVARALGLEEKP